MGTDIHCYIEYQKFSGDWYCFGDHINPGRDYEVFGALAGVRDCAEPIIPVRGLPMSLSFSALHDWFLTVVHTVEEVSEHGCVDVKTALTWKNEMPRLQVINNPDGHLHQIEHPDCHTPSWCTTKELKSVLKKVNNVNVEYLAMLAAMESLEKNGCEVRLTFWFDC